TYQPTPGPVLVARVAAEGGVRSASVEPTRVPMRWLRKSLRVLGRRGQRTRGGSIETSGVLSACSSPFFITGPIRPGFIMLIHDSQHSRDSARLQPPLRARGEELLGAMREGENIEREPIQSHDRKKRNQWRGTPKSHEREGAHWQRDDEECHNDPTDPA